MVATSSLDAALGALGGLAVGDAAGAGLEGRHSVTDRNLARAFQFRPGHRFKHSRYHHDVHGRGLPLGRRGPGQGTDDTEMTLSMATALARHPATPGSLPVPSLIRQYLAWRNTDAHSTGHTTREALGIMHAHSGDPLLAARIIATRCADSRGDSCLMRAAPLAVWGHLLAPEALAAAAREETGLTHASAECRDAVAAYDVALAHLVRCPGDAEGALRAAVRWASAHACGRVRRWVAQAAEPKSWLADTAFLPGLHGRAALRRSRH